MEEVGMTYTRMIQWGSILTVLVFSGCVKDIPGRATPPSLPGLESGTLLSPAVLEGHWEYGDGMFIVPFELDEQGNGPYAWYEGRFHTTEFTGRMWKGTWHQRANDRDGGFEVQLSEDLSKGDGYWWYTRIGTTLNPKKPGAKFHVTRLSSLPSWSTEPDEFYDPFETDSPSNAIPTSGPADLPHGPAVLTPSVGIQAHDLAPE